VIPREGSFALASFGRVRKVQEPAFAVSVGRQSFAVKRILETVLVILPWYQCRVNPSHLRAGGKHQYVFLTDQHSNSQPNVHNTNSKFLKADVRAQHTTGESGNEHRQDADRGRSEW